MEYIFIHAKKDVITEKNDKMKNSKERWKISANKWYFGEVIINLFINKKKCLKGKKMLKKNICEFITYEDLVKFL